MPVDDAVPRNRERVGRDLPREAEAHGDVRLEEAQQRRDPIPCGGHHDVELRWRRAQQLVEPGIALCVAPHAQQCDRLVTEPAQQGGQAFDGRPDLRYENDPQPRSK